MKKFNELTENEKNRLFDFMEVENFIKTAKFKTSTSIDNYRFFNLYNNLQIRIQKVKTYKSFELLPYNVLIYNIGNLYSDKPIECIFSTKVSSLKEAKKLSGEIYFFYLRSYILEN